MPTSAAKDPQDARARRAAFCAALRRADPPLLWDGGLGTALVARGLDLASEPPEAWLLARPDEVWSVHAEFAAAGVDVLQTDSFGLVRLHHGGWPGALGPMPPLQTLLTASVALAGAAASAAPSGSGGGRASAPPYVVISLGPAANRGLEPARLTATYAELAAAAESLGATALHLETQLEPSELRAALVGLAEAAPELPVLVSFTLSVGQFGLETPLGVPLGRMLQELERAPIDPVAVGVNCSQPARRLRSAVAALRGWAGPVLPVLAQPQVGQPAPDCKRPPSPETPERFARELTQLLDDGATALGGCCGARGPHLQAAREAIALLFPSRSTL
ncbi:MAG: homocysteine S-methyltransferase family protein [Polyangia bacterium]